MAKNAEFGRAVANNIILGAEDLAARVKALDDLLKADPTKIGDFRTAIINNKGFWLTFPDLGDDAFYKDDDELLTLDGPPNLNKIRQSVAEQRVLLGLEDAEDDILIYIISNNQDECRAYLASKPESGHLSNVHGWKPDEALNPSIAPPQPPRNTSTEILSDDAVSTIQKQSRDILLSRYIAKSDNLKDLDHLLNAPDVSTVQIAANALHYPVSGNNLLIHPLSDEVSALLNSRVDKLKRAAEFERFVNEDITENTIIRYFRKTLELSDENYINEFENEAKELLVGQDTGWAKGVLGARFLKLSLAESNGNLLPALNSTNAEEMKTELKKFLIRKYYPNEYKDQFHDIDADIINKFQYVDHAVTGNFKELKKAMLQGHIKHTMDDLDQLNALYNATDIGEFRLALREAGISSADWVEMADFNDLKPTIAGAVKHVTAKRAFESFINSFTSDRLLWTEADLQKNDQNFIDSIPLVVTQDLSIEDASWAKGALGIRFLKASLPIEQFDFNKAFNITDEAALATQLKEWYGEYDYIDDAVKGNLNVLKTAVVQGHIRDKIHDENKLKALDAAPDIEKFRSALIAAGVKPVDWVKDKELKEIKQTVRSHLFELQIEKASQLGKTPRPQLYSAFKELPEAKQRELLGKPEQHYHLLNAKDTEYLAHYFGKDANGLADVVKENIRLSSFQRIQNSAVARILAGFKTDITLSPEKIDEINRLLSVAARDPDDAFTNLNKYKKLVEKIANQCGVSPKDFNKDFGLEEHDDRTISFSPAPSVRNKIIEQNEHNELILSEYLVRSQDKLLGVFLTLDKKSEIRPKEILNKFQAAKTYKEFIDRFGPELRTQLASQLPSTLFYELKNEALNNQFKGNWTKAQSAIDYVNTELTSIQDNRQIASKGQADYKFMEGIDHINLYNPCFWDEARTKAAEMKAKYQPLSDNCDYTVDQLRRNQTALQGFLKSIPDDVHILAADQKEKVRQLRVQLKAELEAVKTELNYYENIQKKLSGKDGVLQALDDAKDINKAYEFQAKGVSHRIVERSKLAALTFGPPTGSEAHPSAMTSGGSSSSFQLVNKTIPAGSVEVVDVFRPVDNSTTGVRTEVGGHYSIDTSSGLKYEILKFPQMAPPPREGSPEHEQLIQVRINFARTMVADRIGTHGMPTKENPLELSGADQVEMRYLWTALIVQGVSADAIKLDRYGANQFDPQQEKSSFLGIGTGFKKDALYHKFKGPETEKTVDEVKKISEEKKKSSADRPKVDAEATKAAKSVQERLKVLKPEATRAIEEEGPAPQPK